MLENLLVSAARVGDMACVGNEVSCLTGKRFGVDPVLVAADQQCRSDDPVEFFTNRRRVLSIEKSSSCYVISSPIPEPERGCGKRAGEC